MAPYPKVTTYPPLGHLTIIPPKQDHISLTVVIEWNYARPSYQFDICAAIAGARTGKHQGTWKTAPLARTSDIGVNILDAEDCQRTVYVAKLHRDDFAASVPGIGAPDHYLFTIKLRIDIHSPWLWVSLMQGTQPGELILRRPSQTITNHASVLGHIQLSTEWNTTEIGNTKASSSTYTFLFESKSTIPKPEPGAKFSTLPLALVPSAVRYFSEVRLEPYWLGPRQDKGPFFQTDEDALVSSFLLDNGLILTFVIIGWIDSVYQIFRSDEHGRIVVAALNDGDEPGHFKAVMSAGYDFQETMTSAMGLVRDLVCSSTKITDLQETTQDIISTLDQETTSTSTERWLDSLAFCTWNALGQNLTQPKIMDALEQLQKNNIQISTLLIDDNWQTLGKTLYDFARPHWRGWADMEANTSVAPTGLKDLITDIRTKYPSIKDIGVWHTLMGYWGGISPHGSIAQNYATIQVDIMLMINFPGIATSIAPDALHTFYDDFYSFLRSVGITFVKTDAQHMLSMHSDAGHRRDLIATYQSAWMAAQLKHFHGKAISCMSQTPQTLFHSLMQPFTPAVVLRNSDDFYPDIHVSHPWHVWTNAHNAVFTRHLNVVLDWDMFQTDHEYSAFHAAARCVSGGPILITDTPGRHDVGLIAQMTAAAPGGEAIALRTTAGVTAGVFGLYMDGNVLKIEAGTKCGARLMALFNVAEREVRSLIHVDEFTVQKQDAVEEVLIRGHRTQEVFGPITISTGGGSDDVVDELHRFVHTRLGVRGWDILTAFPIHCVERISGQYVKVCVLGLLGKMSGAAAITATSVSVEDEKINVHIGLKALGRLGVWFDSAAESDRVEVRVQGSKVGEDFLKLVSSLGGVGESGKGNDLGVRIGKAGGGGGDGVYAGGILKMAHIWDVDVEGFWKHHDLWDENCREVVVEVLVG